MPIIAQTKDHISIHSKHDDRIKSKMRAKDRQIHFSSCKKTKQTRTSSCHLQKSRENALNFKFVCVQIHLHTIKWFFCGAWEAKMYQCDNMFIRWEKGVVAAFPLCVKILGDCLTIHSLPALFCVEIRWSILIPLNRLGSVHSGSTNWDDCGQVFPDELLMSSFPDRFLHCAWTAA